MSFVNINSADRNLLLSDSSSNFFIKLPLSLTNITKAELISITLPNTIYKITNRNNNFYWQSNLVDYNITLTNGAYNSFNLLSTIETQMNILDPGNNYSLTYDSITFKVTISSDNPFLLQFNLPNSCFNELGFNNTSTTLNTTFIGDYVMQLYQPLSAFITISEFGTSNYTTSGIQYTFKIPLTVISSGIVQFDVNNFYQQSVCFNGLRNFNQFTILLIDNTGQLLDLNGSNWEMLLKFS